MDTSAIASIITGLLQQYLAKGSATGPGQQPGVMEKLTGLYNLVKGKLGSQPDTTQTMQSFEQAPEQHGGEMQNALSQQLSDDPGFLSQAMGFVQQLKPGAGGSLIEKAGGLVSGLFGKEGEEPGQKAA